MTSCHSLQLPRKGPRKPARKEQRRAQKVERVSKDQLQMQNEWWWVELLCSLVTQKIWSNWWYVFVGTASIHTISCWVRPQPYVGRSASNLRTGMGLPQWLSGFLPPWCWSLTGIMIYSSVQQRHKSIKMNYIFITAVLGKAHSSRCVVLHGAASMTLYPQS